MEDGKQAFLQHGLEVDEHVTAADESQLAEWRVGKHVVRGKDDHFSDIFANLVLVVALDEEPGEALGGNIVHDAFREYAFSSLFYGFGVYVGGKDLNVAMELFFVHGFMEEYSQGISLLAGRAPCAPYPDWIGAAAVLKNVIDDGVLEFFKEFRIPEKFGHAYEDVLDEQVDLVLILFEEMGEAGKGRAVRHHHAPFYAPQDCGLFVIGEVDAAHPLHGQVDKGERVFVGKEFFVI